MTPPPLPHPSFTADPDWVAEAARLLRGGHALAELDQADALAVVALMEWVRCAEGQTLVREGDEASKGFMLLILDGEVTVDNVVPSRTVPVVLSVLGPGHLIGELSLLDDGPRTATCTATLPVTGATLTRDALQRLMADQPAVAAKLLAGVSQRMAARLRDASRQHKVYHQLLTAMQAELNDLNRHLHRVMSGAASRQPPPLPQEDSGNTC